MPWPVTSAAKFWPLWNPPVCALWASNGCLSKLQAAGFYAVHRERPFFESLTDYMSSGPVVCVALRGENAIAAWRGLMGATDPAKAEPGTLRRKYGQSLEANAVHGSDAPETAAFELGYFFNGLEIVE